MTFRAFTARNIGTSMFAITAALAIPAVAQAQAADQSATSPAGDADAASPADGTIIVTGYRAALESAINKKKSSDLVVESVSAEDIGKLPDASIAESIARLPGLTSQRLSGRSNVVSIRGFAPDFSTTLLNGREQTSTGDSRAVEYDQYPSEVINQVNVYKTPMASLVGQGLSGTVDLRTIRPLDTTRTVISIGARGSYDDLGKLNPDSKKYGYRVNGMIVARNKAETLGIALGASYIDEPYQIQEFNAWGYATDADGNHVIGGSKSYNTSTTLKRLGLNGTIQFRPVPEFTSTIDGFYSDFKDDQIKRGIELPLAWGSGVTLGNETVTDGFVTAGTFDNVKGVIRNDAFQRHAKLYSFGWNNQYKGDNGWSAMLDLSYSKTDRNELTLESYSGTGRGLGTGATDTIGFASGGSGTYFDPTLNYGDYSTILLTSPQGWGGNQYAPNGSSILGGQDGYYNNRVIKDQVWQGHIEVSKQFTGSFIDSVQLGWNYTHRSKSLVPDEYFLGLTANTDGLTSVPVPAEFRLGTTDLAYLGLGPMVSYNPITLLNAGIYKLVPNVYGDVVVKSYAVDERLITPYLQVNLKAPVGAAELTGNIGVQAVITDQNSDGATAVYLSTDPVTNVPNIGASFNRSSISYTNWLPSLNLSLRLPSGLVVRFAAAREMIRPRMDDMRNSVSYSYSYATDGSGNQIAYVTGESGNPNLRPWLANAVDLTFEKYFGTKGYLAAQFFYKDLKSYIYNQDVVVDTSSIALAAPADGITVSPLGVLNIPINGNGGHLYGVELAGTLPLGEFVHALDGFGLTGGLSYTESSIQPTPGETASDLPGYSKWVANGTAYFEKWGFNARASVRYRSSFIGEVSGFGANRVRRRAKPETIVDAQIGYDFQEGSALHGLSLFFQGQNLTDAPFVTYNPGDERQVIDYQTYGRRYMAGFTYKF